MLRFPMAASSLLEYYQMKASISKFNSSRPIFFRKRLQAPTCLSLRDTSSAEEVDLTHKISWLFSMGHFQKRLDVVCGQLVAPLRSFTRKFHGLYFPNVFVGVGFFESLDGSRSIQS